MCNSDPMSGRSDDPLIARVQTKFTRSFAWGRHTYCKPAEVLVKILPSELEEDDEEEEAEENGCNDSTGRKTMIISQATSVLL